MRFFSHSMPDLPAGSRVSLDVDFWKKTVSKTVDAIVSRMPPTFDNCDGGLYVGCAGVAYTFYYLAISDPFAENKKELLTRARNYVDVSLSFADSKRTADPPAAFLLGNAGVYAVGSLVYDAIGEKAKSDELNKRYLALAAASGGADELFVGRAGYLCGAYLLNRKFGQVVTKDAIHTVCKSIMHSGKMYSQMHKSKSPLMYAYYNTEYLGAAHGLSAILQMLLCSPDFFKSDPEVEKEIHTAVDFMLGLMTSSGNIAPAMDEVYGGRRPESEELVHWCHGAPGIVYLFAKAFLVWRDDKYLQACLKCGELTWRKGLLKKGPGICHGVGGSGYVFLLLYRMTSDERHLHRAMKFAEFMYTEEFQRGAKTPDAPYSLYEGLAGTVCFLTDLLQPQKAEFPFFDVFSYGA